MALSLPIVLTLLLRYELRVSNSYEQRGYDVPVVTQLIWRKSIFLSTCWLSTNHKMLLDIKELFYFILTYNPADSGSRCRPRYASVTMPEVGMCCLWHLCCKRSNAGFELNLDVKMLLLVDAWEVVIHMSPTAIFISCRYIFHHSLMLQKSSSRF